jgi:hypothetical protein
MVGPTFSLLLVFFSSRFFSLLFLSMLRQCRRWAAMGVRRGSRRGDREGRRGRGGFGGGGGGARAGRLAARGVALGPTVGTGEAMVAARQRRLAPGGGHDATTTA